MTPDIVLVKNLKPEPDGGVPDFGPECPDYQPRALRRSTPDSIDEIARQRLEHSAVDRSLYFAYDIGDVANIQLHFPLGENFQHYPFERSHWDMYGNPETEINRVAFMLNEHPERSFPVEFEPFVQQALATESPLQAWKRAKPQVAVAAAGVYTRIKESMLAQKRADTTSVKLGYTDGFPNAFQSDPILYDTTSQVRNSEVVLWGSALTQIANELQRGNTKNLAAFLDLYSRIKDPITTITSTADNQLKIFTRLLKSAQAHLRKHGITDISDTKGRTLIAQLALESSFLALPAAKDIFYRRGDATDGGEHQELPYVYVNLKDLPRGEFTSPYNVVPRINEMLENLGKYDQLVSAPLTVSYYQTPGEATPRMFLTDGNNRATSFMVMDYILSSGCTFANRLDDGRIDAFMRKHSLHPGWKREIKLTLETTKPTTNSKGEVLQGFTEDLFNRIVANKKRLKEAVESPVAAHLVQEPNFHTVIVDQAVNNRPALPLLQPMHQSVYNHDHGLAMAIPPKNQTHGRAIGNYFLIGVEPKRRGISIGRRKHSIQERPAA